MKILELQTVYKSYSATAAALRGISLDVHAGEFAALSGPSGSGKTSILNLCAGLDSPTSGVVRLFGHDLLELGARRLALLRRRRVGFIFQAYNLFPVLTAIENVEYPLALDGMTSAKRRRAALASLEAVGLRAMSKRYPAQLSGGQQQRVAIARALVTNPRIIFADEPTANLDSQTAAGLLSLFRQLNQERKITFLFSSHDVQVLKIARRVIEVVDGMIKEEVFHDMEHSGVREENARPVVVADLSLRHGECERIF